MQTSQLKAWQPNQVLIGHKEVADAIDHAQENGWPLAPSPINAAFITFLAINKVLNENTISGS